MPELGDGASDQPPSASQVQYAQAPSRSVGVRLDVFQEHGQPLAIQRRNRVFGEIFKRCFNTPLPFMKLKKRFGLQEYVVNRLDHALPHITASPHVRLPAGVLST
jgi:hypothetical protein